MAVIFIIIAIMALILLAWIWTSLGNIEKKTKILCIVTGLIIVYILTFIIFNISKIGIKYENITAMKVIRNVFVGLFTIVNGYVLLPYSFRKLEQINNDEIQKEKAKTSVIILLIVIILLFVFETIYLRNMSIWRRL